MNYKPCNGLETVTVDLDSVRGRCGLGLSTVHAIMYHTATWWVFAAVWDNHRGALATHCMLWTCPALNASNSKPTCWQGNLRFAVFAVVPRTRTKLRMTQIVCASVEWRAKQA